MQPATYTKAREIGAGNLSAGVALAVNAYKRTTDEATAAL
jgi:hypothetical protein